MYTVMNYDLARTSQSEISYTLDQAIPYGDMPPGLLMAKYEETDMSVDEDMYDNYARKTLTNWGPDTNTFAHEEPRGGVNKHSAKLQLQYYGHRGDADDPYRPEQFYGFGGPEDHDPRGINVDPDMKEYKGQQEARMRFVRWDPDSSDHITGGGRSESQVMADQQRLYRRTRDQLAVFDRQIDGRQEGLRRGYAHVSDATKQVHVQSYGDLIKDTALIPVKHVGIICDRALRATRKYQEECSDQDYSIARYGRICKAAAARDARVVKNSLKSGQAEMGESKDQRHRAAGALMVDLVKAKRAATSAARGDADFGAEGGTQVSKTAVQQDLHAILQSVAIDSELSKSAHTRVGKTAEPARGVCPRSAPNHSTPVHHLLNASAIYKNVKPGNTRAVLTDIATDNKTVAVTETRTATQKTATEQTKGASRKGTEDADRAESSRTYNYKRALDPNGDKAMRLVTVGLIGDSDNTQVRRQDHTEYRVNTAEDTVEDMRYGNNASKERHARGLGSKYLSGYIDRDSRADEISSGN